MSDREQRLRRKLAEATDAGDEERIQHVRRKLEAGGFVPVALAAASASTAPDSPSNTAGDREQRLRRKLAKATEAGDEDRIQHVRRKLEAGGFEPTAVVAAAPAVAPSPPPADADADDAAMAKARRKLERAVARGDATEIAHRRAKLLATGASAASTSWTASGAVESTEADIEAAFRREHESRTMYPSYYYYLFCAFGSKRGSAQRLRIGALIIFLLLVACVRGWGVLCCDQSGMRRRRCPPRRPCLVPSPNTPPA